MERPVPEQRFDKAEWKFNVAGKTTVVLDLIHDTTYRTIIGNRCSEAGE
jgi:hypothetical protein